jgi:two-component system, NarL family, invasion response regulator UvrY
MRFLLVDDHPIVRRGVTQLLSTRYPNAVFDEADQAAQAMQLAEATHYDLVVLDLSLPDLNGLDCLALLRRRHPDTKVLVMSMHEESDYAARCLKAGAAGYLHKQRAAADIISAVHSVLSEGYYLSDAQARQVLRPLAHAQSMTPHQRLTQQEFRILCSLGSGRRVGEIAAALCRSAKTVSTHRVNILRKMQMRTNAELIRYCISNKLVEGAGAESALRTPASPTRLQRR